MSQTQFDRIETRLPELLSELAAARVPDYFDDMLGQAGRERQRPAWSVPERWLPMGVIARPGLARVPALRPIVLALLVALALVAGVLAFVGSQPTRLPPPFGPAANGQLFYADSKGDLYAMDPTTLATTAIVTGHHGYGSALPSRDGRFIAFEGGGKLYVANSNGSNIRPLAGTYWSATEKTWSPDGTAIAIVSPVNGRSSVTIVNADGTGAATLDPGVEVHNVSYLPDGRIVFLGVGKAASSDTFGIYVMNADGSDAHPILPVSLSDTDFISPFPTPDGKSVVYHYWRPLDSDARLNIVDVDTGQDRPIDVPNVPIGTWLEVPLVSPDGSQLLLASGNACCRRMTVVPTAGGDALDIGPRVMGGSGAIAYTVWSPDGTSVIAYYPELQETWLLDPSGKTPGRKLDLHLTEVPAWQRVGR